MTTNNNLLSDMPTFQPMENNVVKVEPNTIFTQNVPIQVNSNAVSDSSSQIAEPPTTENAIPSTVPSTSATSMSLHSILMNNTTPTSAVSSPASHNTPIVTSHTPKVQPTVNQAAAAAPVNHDQILTKTRLQDLVKEIDPCEQLDEEVEDLLLQLVDDFVNSTVNTACVFAKHRNSNTVEVKDVQLYLEKMYNMWIPGFGAEEVKPYKKPPITEAHKQRLALIRKSLKKY
ncbi:transcription initiation factor TFIID subunit 12 isoform X1 [Planococcus citri]|uniref:transcription initiation factor TFIID subunit 12 isoform X1 n=1 Tax=Planococcus citri TaxID=170843 RepID=UPI0031F899E8